MLIFPEMNPVAFRIGTWPVYWYGMMYLIGFLAGFVLLSLRNRFAPTLLKQHLIAKKGLPPLPKTPNYNEPALTQEQVSDLVFYVALAAIIGGRLGYMLFYDTFDLIHHPLMVFQTWKGGMSFHGGLLGVVLTLWILANKWSLPFLALTDFIAPVVPVGLGAGRIGNFINGELWGRVTNVSWGMVFPHVDSFPRHPSQLYEFAFEGVLLFIILWIYSAKPRALGAVSGLFALLYGIFRTVIEFFREPDAPIGYVIAGLTEGQLLSIPLIIIGVLLLSQACKQRGLLA